MTRQEASELLIELGRFQGQAESLFRLNLEEEQLTSALDCLDRYVRQYAQWLSKQNQESGASS